ARNGLSYFITAQVIAKLFALLSLTLHNSYRAAQDN
ncbi:unnamed protein product, partial [marine sediment metagenome]